MDRHCPLPLENHDTVQLAHGAGGRLADELLGKLFMPLLHNRFLARRDDQALLPAFSGKLAFTTDSYVVTPLFFPGGDIGSLSVHGTVNDLAVGGAVPRYLSAGFVLEEGFPIAELERVVRSMAAAARECGVEVVTGDTKVVGRGQCDGMFITTSGIGELRDGVDLSCSNLRPGDRIIVSGTLGDHGIALLTARHGLSFTGSALRSDSAPLHRLVAAMLDRYRGVHAMRDATRGGLSAVLNELASASAVGIVLQEDTLPVDSAVRGAAELLGIDPLEVANEGKLVAVVPQGEAEGVLEAMRACPDGTGRNAALVGEVVQEHPGMVVMETGFGSRRIVEMPLGEQLPRIC